MLIRAVRFWRSM